jgi:hypothetical protein
MGDMRSSFSVVSADGSRRQTNTLKSTVGRGPIYALLVPRILEDNLLRQDLCQTGCVNHFGYCKVPDHFSRLVTDDENCILFFALSRAPRS